MPVSTYGQTPDRPADVDVEVVADDVPHADVAEAEPADGDTGDVKQPDRVDDEGPNTPTDPDAAADANAAAETGEARRVDADPLDHYLAAQRRWGARTARPLDLQDITEASGQGLEGLQSQRQALLSRRNGNRVWFELWNDERSAALEMLELTEVLLDGDGAGSAPAIQRNIELRRQDAVTEMDAALGAIQEHDQEVAAARDALAAGLAGLPQAIARLETTSRAQTKAVAVLEKRRDRARRAWKSGTQDVALGEALAGAEAELAEALRAAAATKAELDAAIEAARIIPRALRGRIDKEAAIPDFGGLLPTLQILQRNEEAVAILEARRDAAQSALDDAERAAVTLQGRAGVVAARRQVLRDWRDLATENIANLDDHYLALANELGALERRLGDYEGWKRKGGPKAVSLCETAPAPKDRGLIHFEKCAEAITVEMAGMSAWRDRVVGALSLALTQTGPMVDEVIAPLAAVGVVVPGGSASGTKVGTLVELRRAQEVAYGLITKEKQVAGDELRRIAGDASNQWAEIWRHALERSNERAGRVRLEQSATRAISRKLHVGIEVGVAEVRTVQRRLAEMEVYRDTQLSALNWLKALALSAWVVITGAYMVPVYLLLAWILLLLTRRSMKRLFAKRRRGSALPLGRADAMRAQTLADVAYGGVKLLVYVMTAILCVSALGVDVAPLLGGAAIFGVAISFGSQSLVRDVVTGFFVLVENQYAVGDLVTIGGHTGTVETITLRRTVLRDLRGVVHSVPNGSVGITENLSRDWIRVVIHVGVAYGSDLTQVQVVVDAAGDEMFAEAEWSERLIEAPRYAGVVGLDAGQITVRIWFKTHSFENYAAEREFHARIKTHFDAADIDIPLPQRVLHFVGALPTLPPVK